MDACPQGGRAAGDGRPLPVVHDGTGDLHHGQNKRTSPAHSARRDTTGVRQQAQGDAGQNQNECPVQAPARAQEADTGDKKDPLAL